MTDLERAISEGEQEVRRAAFDLATTTKRYVTVSELAEYLSCGRRTIVRMIDGGSLAATRTGRSYRIPADKARETFHVEYKRAS
jgi:excisionase family DNA binding protein